MRLFLASILVVLSGLGNPAISQQASTSVVASDKANRNAYRALFVRAALYKKLSDEADAAHSPKPQLRRILPARFGLSDADGASLERLALAYQNEIAPIHQQIAAAISQFRARLASGIPGTDTTPPPELAQLQQQADAVTLRYRDLLHNSMREEAFQKADAKILENFGKPLTH
jgi:hypothetical protein